MQFAYMLPYIQITLSIILILLVALQQSEAGLGSLGGGDTGITHRTRRGFEKFLFIATIIVGILFLASSIFAIIL